MHLRITLIDEFESIFDALLPGHWPSPSRDQAIGIHIASPCFDCRRPHSVDCYLHQIRLHNGFDEDLDSKSFDKF